MAVTFPIPKDKHQRESSFAYLCAKGKSRRNPKAVQWWLSSFYLRGIRNFTSLDYNTGNIQIAYLDESGVLKFKYEDCVSKYAAQLGRLLALDLSPAVKRKGVSLDGMKAASTAQVVLDAAFPEDKVKKLALSVCPSLLVYGTVGLALWIEGEDSIGIEVVPPWELTPLPIDVANPADKRGLMRTRYVPTEWIKNLVITPGPKSKEYKKIDDLRVPVADLPPDITSKYIGQAAMSVVGGGFFIHEGQVEKNYGGASKTKKADQTYMDITQLTEVWMETSDGYLADYFVYAGVEKFVELYHHDHSQSKYHMPIRVARDVLVNDFWGRSFVELQMPLNTEIEYALSSLFQAVSDFDLYGLQLWPTTLGDSVEAERGHDGIKRIRYEPDYTAPDLKPENVMPARMTQPQINAITMAASLNDRIANQPTEMLGGGAPGRVDSSAGLGFLYEVSSIPLTPTAKNLADAVSGVYRSMLGIIKDMWSDQKVVSVSNLDDSLAGIVLDAGTGTLSLSKNAIPEPDEISLTVASEVPVSKEQQKAELKEAFKDGRLTQDEFNFAVRKKGLDIPVGGEVEWQNYRRAMYENIILFGDGETPGQVIYTERDLHRIHLQVLDAFMARPEFYAASQQVRDAFAKHRNEHWYDMGNYPDQLPMPEEIAEASMAGPQGVVTGAEPMPM